MIKEQVFNEVADEFQTSIGVAHIMGFKTKKDQIREDGIESFKTIEPNLEINAIICDTIEMGSYHELQREVYKLKQRGDRRLKELTIYRRAFDEIITKNENYITESGQIF
jgi:hypothetical protein